MGESESYYCDLVIKIATDIIAKFANSHEKVIQHHINIEESKLFEREQYLQSTQTEETV
jgi:hypothetical protein